MASKVDMAALASLTPPRYYNRTAVDRIYVDRLVEALRAGATLPPIRVDRASLEIIDGMHRFTAYQQFLGKDGMVPVVRAAFAGEEEKFLFGIRENVGHGRALGALDMKHCIDIAERSAFSLERVQVALSITPERFTRYAQECAHTESGQKVILPRSMRHLAGRIVPDASMQAIRSSDGSTLRHHARQLHRALSRGLVDWLDDDTVVLLHELYDTLGRVLPAKSGAA